MKSRIDKIQFDEKLGLPLSSRKGQWRRALLSKSASLILLAIIFLLFILAHLFFTWNLRVSNPPNDPGSYDLDTQTRIILAVNLECQRLFVRHYLGEQIAAADQRKCNLVSGKIGDELEDKSKIKKKKKG